MKIEESWEKIGTGNFWAIQSKFNQVSIQDRAKLSYPVKIYI